MTMTRYGRVVRAGRGGDEHRAMVDQYLCSAAGGSLSDTEDDEDWLPEEEDCYSTSESEEYEAELEI